jgi:outer membrane protein TolC
MVKRALIVGVALCFRLPAEVHPMTLREAVERAVRQNPDITLARLDEESARHGVQVAKDPFVPRLNVGSGLAYSNGFPMSIEGSAPSVVQARASQFLFNRQQSYAVAQAKEQVRGAGMDVASKRDEAAYRTASLYLEAERAARVLTLARKDAESLQTVLAAIEAQVKEGRALPLAEKQAALELGQQSFREVKKAEMAAEVARLDLEVAREQLSVNLAQMQEGRLTLRQVEEARVAENGKWIAFYDAQYAVEKARWGVLRLTGELVPAIEGMP